jgi:hypothetical protein
MLSQPVANQEQVNLEQARQLGEKKMENFLENLNKKQT